MEEEKSEQSENLNKENFWDELYELYPDAMKLFCDWIDAWKENNNWNFLFNVGRGYRTTQGEHALAPKYHDLPLPMQIGIWIFFEEEHCEKIDFTHDELRDIEWRERITEFMKQKQDFIKPIQGKKR